MKIEVSMVQIKFKEHFTRKIFGIQLKQRFNQPKMFVQTTIKFINDGMIKLLGINSNIIMSNFWRGSHTVELYNRDSSDGPMQSTSTARRDASDSEVQRPKKISKYDVPCPTECKKSEKKEFLKKGSRKFLACTGRQSQTCRDKENGASIPKRPARRSRDTKTREHSHTDLDEGETTPQSRCPSKIQPTKQSSYVSKCIPPQLLISRLSGKLLSQQETQSVIRRVYSDGRIFMHYKQGQITEEYLDGMVLTSWSHGDWKLQWDNRTLYRLESINQWEVDGRPI